MVCQLISFWLCVLQCRTGVVRSVIVIPCYVGGIKLYLKKCSNWELSEHIRNACVEKVFATNTSQFV